MLRTAPRAVFMGPRAFILNGENSLLRQPAIRLTHEQTEPPSQTFPHYPMTTSTLAIRLRTYLEARAVLGQTLTYLEAAQALQLQPPQTIHQITNALEQLMAEDVAADRPLIAALVVSKWRDGLPAPGFFDCAAQLGRLAADASAAEKHAFHAGEFRALVNLWGKA